RSGPPALSLPRTARSSTFELSGILGSLFVFGTELIDYRRRSGNALAESSLSGKARRNTGISGREPGSTSGSRHGVGDLFTALRRQGLIADELVLQLTTFLRSLDLFLELIVLTTSTLTANQVRHGGKQGTHNPELSCIHSSLPSIDFTPAEPPA